MPHLPALTRRDLLRRCGMGFGMLGLAGILGENHLLEAVPVGTSPWRRGRRTFQPEHSG